MGEPSFLAAARQAALCILESPSPDGVPTDAVLAVRARLAQALVDALDLGLAPALIHKAALAASAVLAAAHNDGSAGEGIVGYEGPRLIPLHTCVLTYLVNRLHSDG